MHKHKCGSGQNLIFTPAGLQFNKNTARSVSIERSRLNIAGQSFADKTPTNCLKETDYMRHFIWTEVERLNSSAETC